MRENKKRKIGDKSELPEQFKAREVPSDRKPTKNFVSESTFQNEWIKPE